MWLYSSDIEKGTLNIKRLSIIIDNNKWFIYTPVTKDNNQDRPGTDFTRMFICVWICLFVHISMSEITINVMKYNLSFGYAILIMSLNTKKVEYI